MAVPRLVTLLAIATIGSTAKAQSTGAEISGLVHDASGRGVVGATLTLLQALEKLSLAPARRLETRVPAMKNKGRLRPGADADLVLFDPEKILDHATYEQSSLPSTGIHHVLVNGTFIVKNGQFVEATHPGQPIRAPLSR